MGNFPDSGGVSRRSRIVAGFALAPMASGLLQAALLQRWAAFGVIAVSYPAALLTGGPVLWLTRWRGVPATAPTIGVGAGLAAGLYLLLVAVFGVMGARVPGAALLFGASIFAVHGAAVAGCFWLVAFWRLERRR